MDCITGSPMADKCVRQEIAVTHLACVLQCNTRYYLYGDQISGIFYGNKHLVSERVDGGHLIYTPDTPARLSTSVFTPVFTPQPPVIRMYYECTTFQTFSNYPYISQIPHQPNMSGLKICTFLICSFSGSDFGKAILIMLCEHLAVISPAVIQRARLHGLLDMTRCTRPVWDGHSRPCSTERSDSKVRCRHTRNVRNPLKVIHQVRTSAQPGRSRAGGRTRRSRSRHGPTTATGPRAFWDPRVVVLP